MAKKQVTKMVINIGTKSGKTEKILLQDEAQAPLYGYVIGDEFEGNLIGEDYDGYVFKITGGTDKNGFPLRPDFEGNLHYKPLLSKGVGYKPRKKGERKRKRLRGNEIQDDVAQLNCVVVKEGSKPLSE